jgi:hypothetical protein
VLEIGSLWMGISILFHGGDNEEEDAYADGAYAEDQEGMGWTDDLDVEAVGCVPQVVKGR